MYSSQHLMWINTFNQSCLETQTICTLVSDVDDCILSNITSVYGGSGNSTVMHLELVGLSDSDCLVC